MKILLRADASEQFGASRAMRVMVLGGELARRGHDVTFASLKGSLNLLPLNHDDSAYNGIKKVELEEKELTEISALKASAPKGAYDLAFVDGHHLSEKYEEALTSITKKLAVLDDAPTRKHMAKMLIDPAFGRRPVEYKDLLPHDASILTGARFAALRPEFLAMRPKSLARRGKSKAAARESKHIVVHFGLTDQHNLTCKILEALKQVETPTETTVVISRVNQHKDEVERACKSLKNEGKLLVAHTDMASLLQECDLVIGIPGNSAWERCCMGVPSFHVAVTSAHETINKNMAGIGAIFDLGAHQNLTPDAVAKELNRHFTDELLLVTMSQSAALLCDGNGANRIVEHLESFN